MHKRRGLEDDTYCTGRRGGGEGYLHTTETEDGGDQIVLMTPRTNIQPRPALLANGRRESRSSSTSRAPAQLIRSWMTLALVRVRACCLKFEAGLDWPL